MFMEDHMIARETWYTHTLILMNCIWCQS